MHHIASTWFPNTPGTADTGRHRIEVYVPGDDFMPPFRISVDPALAPVSSDMCSHVDHNGGMFICLRNEQKDNKWEKVRVSSEKLADASEVFDTLIDDAMEKAVDAGQTSPLMIRLQEPYSSEIMMLLHLLHGLDGCVLLDFAGDWDTITVEIRSNGKTECETTFSFKALEALATKYRCRPAMYKLALKDLELNMPRIANIQRLGVLAEVAFKAHIEEKYLQVTAEMLSTENSSDLDDVTNPCLRDLLKSRKLHLLEMRLKVYEAQRDCLSKLKDAEQAKPEFRDEEGGVCDAQYRLNTLLKIFEDANLIASTLEKALEKVPSGNIYLEAFDRAVERNSHVCDGQLQGHHQFTDCPLNLTLMFLSTHPVFHTETPKGISWEDYAAEEHHDERWPLTGMLRPLGGGGDGGDDDGPPEQLEDQALSK